MLSATPNRSAVPRRSVFFFLTLCFLLFVTCASMWAAQPDRIVGAINNSQTVVLKGTLLPNAQPQYDKGPMDLAMKLPFITLLIQPSAEQQGALKQLLAE